MVQPIPGWLASINLILLPLMFVLGIIYYKKRKLLPLMIGHAILDLVTGAQILMAYISPSYLVSIIKDEIIIKKVLEFELLEGDTIILSPQI